MKSQQKRKLKKEAQKAKAAKNTTIEDRMELNSLITKKLFGPEKYGMPSYGNAESDILSYKIQLKLHDEYLKYTKPKKPLISQHNKKLLFERLNLEKTMEKDRVITEDKKEEETKSKTKIGEMINSIAQQFVEKEKVADIPDKYRVKENSSRALALASTLSKSKDAVILRQKKVVYPKWHAPWKLMRVISGHTGWVRSVAIDPTNHWFVTGSNDRTIKFWDLVSGELKMTLTGHISTVRGVEVSPRHPYVFSCGEDKKILCWDLQVNKVVRHYHGHLSGIYCLKLHPELDILVTGGRDSTARVWDMRTKNEVHCLAGHSHTVEVVATQKADPQVITGSHDTMVRLWDLAMGKCMATLTHHKKGVKGLAIHNQQFTFCSGGADKIRMWKLPEGQQIKKLEGHNDIINSLALNQDNVLVSGGNAGDLCFWDWQSGYMFQRLPPIVQPGSLACEAGIYGMTFDRSGLRLITADCDKTIKIYKEDENATPESHPIDFSPSVF